MRLGLAIAGLAILFLAGCSSHNPPASTTSGGPSSSATPQSVPTPGWPVEVEGGIGDRVFFGSDRYDLTQEAQAQLRKQAQWLEANPHVHFVIEGHCDERGTREYNLALGERRATAVKNYFVALGIDPSRMQTISYGKERPAVLDHDEHAWAQNRRAVSVVLE
jgi:peptidoglycan-associated lipoprotein